MRQLEKNEVTILMTNSKVKAGVEGNVVGKYGQWTRNATGGNFALKHPLYNEQFL